MTDDFQTNESYINPAVTHKNMDILKACVYYKTKGLQESVAFADEVDFNLDTIGKLLGIRIIFIGDSHQMSNSDGPELFMRYKNKRLIFHHLRLRGNNLELTAEEVVIVVIYIVDIW